MSKGATMDELEDKGNQSYQIEGHGKQLNYSDYLTYKQEFNDSRTVSYSSSDLYRKRLQERDSAILDSLFYGTTTLGVTSLLYHQVSRNEGISNLISEMPAARLAKTKLTKQFLDNKSAGIILDAIDPRSKGTQHLSQSLHSMLMGIEEMSPLQLMKTLQLSSFSTLFVEILDAKHQEARHIREASIKNYGDYYRNLIKNEAKISLTDADLKAGFIIQNNTLYQAVKEGDTYRKGRVLLKHAKIITSGYKTGDHSVSTNRIAEKYVNRYGVQLTRSVVEREPFMVVGSNTKNKLLMDWVKSYGAFSVELGAKSLDNPLGFLEEYINLTGAHSNRLFQSRMWQTARQYADLQLGSGGVYNIGSREMLKRMGKNLVSKGSNVVVGFTMAEALVDAIAPENSVWSNGIVAGLSAMAMDAHVKFAQLWSDNFQNVKRAQEYAAPGSTSLLALAGIPLAGAMLGANIAYFKRIGETPLRGMDNASVRALEERRVGGIVGDILDRVGRNSPTNSLGRNAKVGALIGAAIALPFLPGALVGKSSEELRKEYSGEKKVAVRQNRYWLCLTPDSPVFTDNGLKRADEVSTIDGLFDRNGQRNPVIEVHTRYTRESVVVITTHNNLGIPTKVTKDHEVLTRFGWKPAKKLCIGDELVVGIPKLSGEVTSFNMFDYYQEPLAYHNNMAFSVQRTRTGILRRMNKKICNQFIPSSFHLGLFLGWFLAEGSLHKTTKGYSALEISFHKSEIYFAEFVMQELENILGVPLNKKIHRNSSDLGCRIRFGNSVFADFVYKFLYRDSVKIFPDLSKMSEEFVSGFLKGMFFGDGGIKKSFSGRNIFYIKAANIQHLVEFRRYSSCFGAYGSIYMDRGSGCFKLDFSGKSSKALANLGLEKALYKYEEKAFLVNSSPSYSFEDDKIYLKIKSLEVYEYEGLVYDYTIEDVHEYTPGSFVIHNSGGGEYEGGKIMYHRDNLLRTLAYDSKTKSLYGDRDTKRELNPFWKPFRYLNEPYAFEEMHTHDMPMPVWGMDVSYGSFMGQAFKGTVGQLIKPTVINPAVLEDQQELLGDGITFKTKMTLLSSSVNRVLSLNGKQLKGELSEGPLPLVLAEGEYNSVAGMNIDSDAYITPEHEKKDVKSLVSDGLMLRPNAPTNEPYTRAGQGTWSAGEEFIGLKGFVGGLTLGLSGTHPVDQLRPELEISGSATNFSKTIMDAQLGDALGCFLPNTPVLTSTGYKAIQNVREGDKVLSFNYKYRRVLETHSKVFKEIPILNVYIEGHSRPIKCTPDHVFPSLCINTMSIEDREIGALVEGDYLLRIETKNLHKCVRFKSVIRKGKHLKTIVLRKISKIEGGIYSGPVYDLSIDVTPYYTVHNIICHNSGEYLRRLFPQSASSKRETINPMRNLVAPDWLPSNDTKFYKNFHRGNYLQKVENGEFLLPGTKGFESLNPELAGVDPNEYPLVYQYSILQNVARNSSEHIAIKEFLVRNLDQLSDTEKEVFFEAYGQDEAREQLKRFSEYATEEEKNNMGLFNFHNAIWEFVAHKESPLEPLLPFRPMGKFVHKRTAEEDYIKTQVLGPDTGIWTNPYSHFIKPSANRIARNIDGGFIPEEYEEKNRIDRYFDKLALIKADRNGDIYEKERNITALSYTGIRDAEDMRRFKKALDPEQRAYVDSFSRVKDKEKREELLKILPTDIGRVYQSIWHNIDLYDYAVAKGLDPKKVIDNEYLKDTAKIAKASGVSFSFKERTDNFKDLYLEKDILSDYDTGKLRQAKELRMKAALKDANDYVTSTTGSLPDKKWVGWDPRLKIDDIKLKTLMVGREDIHRFGYWSQDVERIERLVGLKDVGPIVDELENIKRENREVMSRELELKNRLRKAGFEATRITSNPASKGAITVNDKTDYLENYYGGR